MFKESNLVDNKVVFQKFEKLATFVKNDLFNVLNARANFLFAQCIFNYIEIFGSFLQPNCNNTKRFEAFWERLIQCSPAQNGYASVRTSFAPKTPYDILRCGLSHEGLPKEKPFIIGNPHEPVQLEQLRNLRIKLPDGNTVDQEGGIFI